MGLSHPKFTFMKGDRIYFYKNTGLQNQSILYVKDNVDTPDSLASIVIDPNTFFKKTALYLCLASIFQMIIGI